MYVRVASLASNSFASGPSCGGGATGQSASELLKIPGVGPRVAAYFTSAGIARVADLREADPDEIYQRMCMAHGRTLDRCLLYVVRCAVYYASTPRPKPELLEWWNWKDVPSRDSRRQGRKSRVSPAGT